MSELINKNLDKKPKIEYLVQNQSLTPKFGDFWASNIKIRFKIQA